MIFWTLTVEKHKKNTPLSLTCNEQCSTCAVRLAEWGRRHSNYKTCVSPFAPLTTELQSFVRTEPNWTEPNRTEPKRTEPIKFRTSPEPKQIESNRFLPESCKSKHHNLTESARVFSRRPQGAFFQEALHQICSHFSMCACLILAQGPY